MIEVPPDQVAPSLRALFDPGMPAGFRCFAVLDGTVAGRIVTDDPLRPTWGAVQEGAFGTVYPGGALNRSTWRRLIADLRKQGDVLIGMWPDDPRLELLPADPEYDGLTLDFTDRAIGTEVDSFLQTVPAGCDLRALDRQLFDQSEDRDFYSALYGSTERAFEHLGARFLICGEEICCESYAYFAALGTIEIAASTREQYRGRGYATIACAALIQDCERQGYQTYWNCARQNLASAALARKLGYRAEREYRLLAWFKKR